MPAPALTPRLVNSRRATGTVLAFDFGEKFTGVAVGESSVGMAHPLALITAESNVARMKAIAALVAEWKPGFLVVGLPLSMNGTEHELTRRCRRFARQLESRFRLPVRLVDERLSSAAAEEALRAAGKGGRKHKLHAHQVSAQIILQSYFDDPGSS
ncbi:MAG: Holliday junction resolvase RuvX [Betaproteobacteria bacterium]|nr:Holliday junction resolvase RuvX [Betaproteobacteria bacterium]